MISGVVFLVGLVGFVEGGFFVGGRSSKKNNLHSKVDSGSLPTPRPFPTTSADEQLCYDIVFRYFSDFSFFI